MRRLAAILAADVVGYSRLMEQDEAGTLAALKVRREAVLGPLLKKHRGRTVKVMGDGVLVEFASAVDAVQCAVELQQQMAVASDGLPEERRIVLRIGINLGDVIVEGGDLYGDGVNLAARLQAMAEPGGIFLSGGIREQIERKLAIDCEDLGDQAIKNIARPVRVFRVSTGNAASEPSVAGRAAHTRPSVAVLPFTNMSGDPEQQYLSDGITEDIITELSRYRSLLVIARNSSFQFRGPSVEIAAVRRKLNVRFVVEGSIRKMGQRLRLTAQLIDAATESHVWAERYDREVEDIFAVQDDVTRAIVATLEGRVAAIGAEQAKRRPTGDWVAYDYFLQGREWSHRYIWLEAEPFFARAIELDDRYVHAYASRAMALVGRYWHDRLPTTMEQALDCARRALSLDDTDAQSHLAMGFVLAHQGQLELAGPYVERAVALNPNDVPVAIHWAWWLARMGRADEAIESLDIVVHREPFPPAYFWEVRGIALLQARRYQDVIHMLARTNILHAWDHAYIAACHAYLNRPAEARAAAREVLRADPHFTLSRYAQVEGYILPAELEHLIDGMRKAGLPE